jgi:hypothetical protein
MNSRPSIRLVITHHPSGAISVEGPIGETAYCLSLLENAKDAVRNHKKRRPLIIPSHDVQVEQP